MAVSAQLLTPLQMDQFNFLDCVIMIGNIKITGLHGVTYEGNSDLTPVYIMGQKDPVALSEGKRDHNGSVKMLSSTYQTLLKAAKLDPLISNISDLGYVTIIQLYVNTLATRMVEDRYVGCKFTEPGRKMELDDPFEVVELKFKCLQYKPQTKVI